MIGYLAAGFVLSCAAVSLLTAGRVLLAEYRKGDL